MSLGTLDASSKPAAARAEPLFADKWLLLTVVVGTIAFLKGLRLPNVWSATQMQVDYSLGFVKRGLAGEIAGLLQIPIYRYTVFALVALTLLIIASVLVVVFLRRGLSDSEFRLYLPVFASSMAISYMVHCVGYLDFILLILLMTALLTTSPRLVMPVGLAASAIGVLIHEMYLLSFLPVLLFRIALDAALAGKDEQRKHLVFGTALVVGVGIVTALLALAKPMTLERVTTLHAQIDSRVDFAMRHDFFLVLQSSLRDNIDMMLELFMTRRWWIDEMACMFSLLWVAGLFIHLAITRARTRPALDNRLATPAIVIASLAPASLQLIGLDIYRWYSLCVLNSVLVYTLVVLAIPRTERQPEASVATYQHIAMLVAVNMATAAGYFDSFRGSTFPFIDNYFRG